MATLFRQWVGTTKDSVAGTGTKWTIGNGGRVSDLHPAEDVQSLIEGEAVGRVQLRNLLSGEISNFALTKGLNALKLKSQVAESTGKSGSRLSLIYNGTFNDLS
jgi:hypothetical protein